MKKQMLPKQIFETIEEQDKKIRQKAIKIFIRKKIIEVTIAISGIAALIFMPYFIGLSVIKIFDWDIQLLIGVWYAGFVSCFVLFFIIFLFVIYY